MSKIPVINVVACLLPNMGIGFQGGLPWRLSKEMKFFKQLTTSTFDSSKKNVVIMGRKTWQSIPARFRPLPNRINVVLSRSYSSHLSESEDNTHYVCNSLTESLKQIQDKLVDTVERIYIIGGSEIYNGSFRLADHWLITKIQPIQNIDEPAPMVDTFIKKDMLLKYFKEDHEADLNAFLPGQVELPEQLQNEATSLRYKQEEKGLEFGFSLWNKI
ncbi:hypothetical protein TPHA_0G01680 [Tetrapisispora phaffii CBS 4417]|uniref:Dihydrofolate reductase n=1 Tax=Tetrapisispora phaffii (strain ATCC 24235 / CBS 4417 / NBRC 1672 / NRRL Y-8282 / UCD 70-5) TaxID=1071381 RepID=G8BVS6_TETPH|nr:hypothetical protein TPHA_0G01680 [Tetrapisispora phaffii CBS 4417]CCE64004.1 hypothetical protein TPHA_0G01680 [Tetrapisispora phaffii CBS 4417]